MLILRHVSIDGEIDVLLVYLGHFSLAIYMLPLPPGCVLLMSNLSH